MQLSPVERLKNLQGAVNALVVAHIAVSHALGELIVALETGCDAKAAADDVGKKLNVSRITLEKFCDAANDMSR